MVISRSARSVSLVLVFLCFCGLLQAQVSRAPVLYTEGLSELESEHNFRAIELFKEANVLNSRYLEPMVGLAKAYYFLEEYDEALRWVKLAIAIAKDDASLLNIHGRILLALGKTDESSAIFRSILKVEPYNIDAMLGLAEFSLAKGDELGAKAQYLKSLTYNQQDRRILLSLSLMFEDQGDKKQAETYLLKALHYYADSPLVQTIAAEYYLRIRQWKDAEFHAKTALALYPSYIRALRVLAELYVLKGENPDAIAIIDQVLKLDQDNSMAWYMRALALKRMFQVDDSINSFARSIAADPADEISRLMLEDNLVRSLPVDDPRRIRFADYHFEQAIQFRKKNLYPRAGFHYMRGLQVAPLHAQGRIQYAEYLKQMNYSARLYEQLLALKEDLKVNTSFVNDYLEIYRSILSRSVSSNWKLDQFTGFDRDPLVFRIFMRPERQAIEHPDAAQYLALYIRDLMTSSDKVTFRQDQSTPQQAMPRFVANESEAFRIARDERADYYVLIDFSESGDDFKVVFTLYLARTGTIMRTYTSYRTGNFRVQNAIWQNVESLLADTPLRGKLLNRQVDDGLISIGAADGIKAGDVLHLISRDGYMLQGDTPGFIFSADKKVGTFTVTRVDERVSEGTIKREGFFDRINLGDVVLRGGETILKAQDAISNFPFLYNRIRSIR